MTALFYILQSAVQVLGIFYLSFSLFRFKLRSYLGETLFFSALIGGIIYFVRVYLKFGIITPMVVCFLMIMFMWLVIKIPVLYSTLMIVIGYLGIYVVETLLIYLGQRLDAVSLDKIQTPGSLESNILMIITNSILYFLAWWLYRRGLGFSFSFRVAGFKKESFGFFLAILLSIAVDGILYYSVINFGFGVFFATLFSTVSLCTLLYLSIRKEYKEHD